MFHIFSWTARFSGEKSYWTQNVCFDIVWNISYYKKKCARYDKKMCIGLQVKNSLFSSDFNVTWTFSTDFRKIFKYQISWKSVQWEPSSVRIDRRTDMTKLYVPFRDFANVPKKRLPHLFSLMMRMRIVWVGFTCIWMKYWIESTRYLISLRFLVKYSLCFL